MMNGMMQHERPKSLLVMVTAAMTITLAGCTWLQSAHTTSQDYRLGDAPITPPKSVVGKNFDDHATGGEVYRMHCGRCHNARPLSERPFALNEVSAAHMREQAYLTGKEYRSLIHFLRRWSDVGPPTPNVESSPKRTIFRQPILELRPQTENDVMRLPSP